MQPGGNSGVFVWSEGFVPEGQRLPKGMEVQMLELQWVHLHRKPGGEPQDIGYISGELFAWRPERDARPSTWQTQHVVGTAMQRGRSVECL